MKVSVIISNRNRGPLLDLALQSILAQDRDGIELEVIVGDDTSTDNSAAVCAKHGVTMVGTGQGGYSPCGGARTLNLAYTRSTGDIIIQQNAEIVHLSNCIQQLARAVEGRDQTAVFATVHAGPAKWLNEKSRDGKAYQHYTPRVYCGRTRPVPFFFLGATTRAGYLQYRDDLSSAADWDCAKRMIAAGYQFEFLDTAVGFHCDHSKT